MRTILLVVYAAFSKGVAQGIWHQLSLADLGRLVAVDAALLAAVPAITTYGSRLLGFSRADEVTIVFCGSKKSLASGLPMATVLLLAGRSVGLIVLPLMIFHQIQLMVCATLAKRHANPNQEATVQVAGAKSRRHCDRATKSPSCNGSQRCSRPRGSRDRRPGSGSNVVAPHHPGTADTDDVRELEVERCRLERYPARGTEPELRQRRGEGREIGRTAGRLGRKELGEAIATLDQQHRLGWGCDPRQQRQSLAGSGIQKTNGRSR